MLTLIVVLSSSAAAAGCSSKTAGDSMTSGPDSGEMDPDASSPVSQPPTSDQELAQASGCQGVYNPDQVLDYYIELSPGDWSALLADQTNSVYFPAQFRCGDEAPITVGIRRKRSGGMNKVGLKVDFNAMVSGQTYYGLKKLSLENGVSEGTTEDGAEASTYLTEYLAWRMMVLSGAISSRAAFANIHVNGELLGVYTSVEQVDKRFLAARLGDDSGWLYKHSGSADDGFKTHENDGLDDPYDDYFCFWQTGNTCAPPSADELARDLPSRLNIDQMLRFGAVNALIANTDSPLFKYNNYYWCDYPQGRVYLPWDLDTVMGGSFDVFMGSRTTAYTDVLFTHWEDDYDAILTDLLSNALSLEAIQAELARAQSVANSAFASDPYMSGTLADAVAALGVYWTQRHAEVQAQVSAH